MRRHIIIVLAGVTAVVAVIGPIVGLLFLSFGEMVRAHELQLVAHARSVLQRTDEIFGSTERTLREVADATGGLCEAEDVKILQRATFRSLHIREIALIVDGRLVCNTWGVAEPPQAVERRDAVVPPPNQIVIYQRAPDGGDDLPTIVVQARVFDRIAVNAQLNPLQFLEPFRYVRDIEGVGLSILTRDGLMIAGDASLVGLRVGSGISRIGRDVIAVERSWRYPALAAVKAPVAWLTRAWWREALVAGGAGGVAAAALVALIVFLARRSLSLDAELRLAIRRGEFFVQYLPSVDLASGVCVGAEALIRWRHREKGVVRPDLFIPLAEETGLIEPMTEWLMRHVADDLRAFEREGIDVYVGVNLAPWHFRDHRVVDAAREIFGGAGCSFERVMFEITERSVVGDRGPAHEVMVALRALGAKLALDDFGTGYSSLGYLRSFTLDYLKIDKSFIDAIGKGAATSGLVDVIVDMGRKLELKVVAEGVETAEQVEYLRACGCGYGQGWHFAKPLDPAAFREFARIHARRRAA
ncbi:MAG TPA: EAL domain-containing protein [Alphaproteobacteria bacterium]|nr:EAL domain-containing protein [Alphaproteobacteria bacterium]